jgi:hypothetical protein
VDSSFGWMDGHVFRFTYPMGVTEENVTFTLSDGESEVELRATVEVTQSNDVPEPPVVPATHAPSILGLSVSPANSTVGGPVLVTALAHDEDSQADDLIAWVDIILPDGSTMGNFSMTHVQGTDGFTFTSSFGEAGEHTFVVWVEDGDGQRASSSGTFLVEPESTPGLDCGSGMSTWVWLAVAALAAAIVVAAVAVVGRGGQGAAGTGLVDAMGPAPGRERTNGEG